MSKQYEGQFPRTLHVLDGRQRNWPAELNVLQGHDDAVTSVAFSPDGKHIASGSYDKTIRVWDAETGHVSGPLTGHDDWVTSVAFSPDGKHIASGLEDNTIRVCNSKAVQSDSENLASCVAFSSHGNISSNSENDPLHLAGS